GRYRLPAVPSFIILAAGLLVTADWRSVFSPVLSLRILLDAARRLKSQATQTKSAFADSAGTVVAEERLRKRCPRLQSPGILDGADSAKIASPLTALALLKQHPKVVALAILLCAWVLWGAYTPNIPPMLRSIYQAWRGDLALSSGNTSDAFGRYTLAQQAFPTFFWPYRHAADAARQQGRAEEARALYARSRDLNPEDPYGILGFADLAFQHPEWTLTPDERDWLRRDEADWRGNPWNSFRPSPTAAVDVGTGREIAYIRGFHLPDSPSPDLDYRWTRGRSTIRIPIPPGTTYNAVTVRMSAPSIGPSTPISVSISIDGSTPTNLNVSPGWADYTLPILPGKTLIIEVVSATRTPSKLEPNSRDDRNLGVGIDRITLIRK
ncbi:MAG TPA: hypothetical protein VEW94_06470, partial [Chloroflexia bacterium]|nr:hypothetical protein [Chloroflexia bacterium]